MEGLIEKVGDLVHEIEDERTLTARVAAVLSDALASGLDIPAGARRPDPERYVMYPLHVAEDESFSIASAVWNVGQGTPVHGHETWGVVGILSGQEHELSYQKPVASNVPLTRNGENTWGKGEVTVCCTSDDDVHQVRCEGNEPVVGIHIYGANIGTLERRSYDPVSGDVSWFVSQWAPIE